MKTGLIVAMQNEFELVAAKLVNIQTKHIGQLEFVEGVWNKTPVVLVKSGIGKVAAAVAAVELIKNFAPMQIINTGIAGGLDKGVSVMDVVAGAETAYHDVWCGEGNVVGQVQGMPASYLGDKNLLQKISKIRSDVAVHRGLIVSGDRFIEKLQELKDIKAQFPKALAVDMEGAAVAQVCLLYKVPFLALRIISDTPGIENHNKQYQDFWRSAPEKSIEVLEALLG